MWTNIDQEKLAKYEEHLKSAIEEIKRRTLGSALLEVDSEDESLDELSEGQLDRLMVKPGADENSKQQKITTPSNNSSKNDRF